MSLVPSHSTLASMSESLFCFNSAQRRTTWSSHRMWKMQSTKWPFSSMKISPACAQSTQDFILRIGTTSCRLRHTRAMNSSWDKAQRILCYSWSKRAKYSLNNRSGSSWAKRINQMVKALRPTLCLKLWQLQRSSRETHSMSKLWSTCSLTSIRANCNSNTFNRCSRRGWSKCLFYRIRIRLSKLMNSNCKGRVLYLRRQTRLSR